ncbi:hypothetical protein BT69DRAFT_601982 [Atractiella rhizophila]|nr:hypothetical protein BT69DRAFT_601982 [Atractiella rhizophila]
MEKQPSKEADPAVEALAKDVCAKLADIRDFGRRWMGLKEGKLTDQPRESWEILNLTLSDLQDDRSSRRLSGFSKRLWGSISGARPSTYLNPSGSSSMAALDLSDNSSSLPPSTAHIRRQASLSLDDLPSSGRASNHKTATKKDELDTLEDLVAAVEAFDEAYVAFARLVVERHSTVKAARRQRRFERRTLKLRNGFAHYGAVDLEIPNDSSSVMSTRDLVSCTLALAVDCGWISTDEIEMCDPQVFVILPRLTLLVGVFHATFPQKWDHDCHHNKECDVYFVFLPRVCRGFLKSDIRVLKSLDAVDRSNLALTLGGKEPKSLPSPQVISLFKIISSLADRASQGGKGVSGWIRIMQKVIKARNGMSIAGEEEEDIESVAKELMDAAVKTQAVSRG